MSVGNRDSTGVSLCFALVLLPTQRAHGCQALGKGEHTGRAPPSTEGWTSNALDGDAGSSPTLQVGSAAPRYKLGVEEHQAGKG